MAPWETRRRWVREAFDGARARRLLDRHRAYTAVKDPSRTKFVYRDQLWQGADLAALGVASFGHVNGVHMQNVDTWETVRASDRSRRAAARPRVPADAPTSG